MNSPTRHGGAPALGFRPNVQQVAEFPTLEETLPDIGYAPLHVGLILGVANPGWVGDEAPMLGVFQEAPGEGGMQRIGARHCGGKVVDDQVPGDAAEEGPGRFESGNDVFQLLAEGGPDEAVPGVTQHQDQRPHRASAARARVMDQAQPAEVHLGDFPGRGVLHPHGGPVGAFATCVSQ